MPMLVELENPMLLLRVSIKLFSFIVFVCLVTLVEVNTKSTLKSKKM